MKSQRIGELLGAFFDEKTLQRAGSYSKLFSSWAELTKQCGLSAAADHSCIAGFERGIVMVEADHPGWIQLLQTRERELLNGAGSLFEELGIRGISFRLIRNGKTVSPSGTGPPAAETPAVETPAVQTGGGDRGFEDQFKESLQRLKRTLEGGCPKR
jgi:hypothetical protein